MREQTIYGSALIASVAGLLVTAAFHPTGHQVLASAESLERLLHVTVATHALALASVGLSLHGLVGLSRHLGMARLDVTAALTAFAMAVMGVICAATASGFVAPELARSIFAAEEPTRPVWRQFFLYNGYFNQGFAKFHTVASSAAIVLWSIALLRTGFGRAAGWVGCLVGMSVAGALLSGHLPLNVHGFGLVTIAQGIWFSWVGVLLIWSPMRS